MSYRQHLAYIAALNDQFRYYKTVESLFELDQWSALPPEGGAYRQQVAAHIAQQKAALFAAEDARKAAEYFAGVEQSGIEDEDIVMVRNYKFSNIVAVGQTPEIEEMWANIAE